MRIEAVLSQRYDVGPLAADPTTCTWAAEFLADIDGVDHAKAELTRLNRLRERAGKPLVYIPFGHRLF